VHEFNKQRLSHSQKQIQALLQGEPEKQIFVTLSFKEPIMAHQLPDVLADHPGQVVALWHGFVAPHNTFRGGYVLGKNETLKDAIDSYLTLFPRYLEDQLLDLKAQDEAGKDPAFKKLISDLELRLNYIRKHGTPIYGVALSGPSHDLLRFAEKVPVEMALLVSDNSDYDDPIFFAGGDLE